MATICDDFPQFFGWPSCKVYFLENMAWEQLRQEFQSQQEVEEEPYVVITKDMDDTVKYNCEICTEKLRMDFDQEIEEWVFRDCKGVNGTVYHYPLCYEVALK